MSLVLENVTYRYSQGTAYEITALNHVNLSIGDGEFIGIIGHTGSGKSTLVQHLNGLLKATEGAIYFNGENIYQEKYDLRGLRTQVGMVFQYPEHQLFEATVLEDVCFGPKNQGLSKEKQQERAREALKSVGLDESCYGKSPFELSGGQKRRAAIAGVMAMEPKCIVLDEPTAMLDPDGRKEVLEAVHELNRSKGVTVILITHYMEEVVDADYVFVMDQGKVVMEGEPREIFSHVQELKSHRLDVPQITLLAHELKEAGMDLPDGILTRKELIAAIKEAVGKKHVGAQAE